MLKKMLALAAVISLWSNVSFADPLEKLENLARSKMNGACDVFKADIDGDGAEEIVLANDYLILVFNPRLGGIATHCVYRPKGVEWTGQYGIFEDDIWQLTHDEQEFKKATYEAKLEKSENTASVTLTAKGKNGIYQWLTISKKISLIAGIPRVDAEYSFHNDPASVGVMDVGPWFHQQIGTKGGNTYFVPTTDGVEVAVQGTRSPQDWWRNPSRGWRAVIGKGGVGCVAVMDYRYLKNFYNWNGKLDRPTFEWRFHNVRLDPDETFKTTFHLLFFEGLKRVDDASENAVVGMNVPGFAKPAVPFATEVEAAFMTPGAFDCELRGSLLPNGKSAKIAEKSLHAPTPGKSVAALFNVKLDSRGTNILKARLTKNKSLVGAAERCVIVGKSSADYVMKPRKPNFRPKGEKARKQATFKDLTRYDTSFKTPHFKWRVPSSGGKIKALILVPASGAREIAELAERFDIDFKTIFINQSNPWTNGDFFYVDLDPKIRKGIERLLSENKFDVIVLGGVFWKQYFQGTAESLLLKQVRNGAGLVYIAPHSLSPAITKALPVVPDGDPRYRTKAAEISALSQHPAISAMDFSLLGTMNAMAFKPKAGAKVLLEVKKRPWLTVGSYGKGRVAALTYRVVGDRSNGQEVGGKLTPRIWDYDFGAMGKASKWSYEYWEYSFALLGKTIEWAAVKRPENPLTAVSAALKDGAISLSAKFAKPLSADNGLTLSVDIFDKYSKKIGSASNLKLGAGTEFTFELSSEIKLLNGRNALRVKLKNADGKIVDFATASIQYAAPAIIAKIALSKRDLTPKISPLTGVTRLKGEGRSGDTLRLSLFDAYGREVDVQLLPAGSKKSVPFSLNPQGAKEVQGYVEARVIRDGRVLDVSRAPLKYKLTREERAWREFKIKSYSGMWSLGMPAYLYPYYYGKLADIGFHELEARPDNYQEKELTSQQGFRILASGIAGMKEFGAVKKKKLYLATRDKKYLVRKKDLCDQKALDIQKNKIRRFVKMSLSYSSDYMMYDEDKYSFYGLDFNFSEPSLKAFRKWLRGRYSSLDDLNNQWATKFKSWSDVTPLTLEEMRERQKTISFNAAPWAEHRRFNEITVLKTWKLYKKWIHELDPLARMGQSGTRPTGTYGGNDWSRLAKIMDFIELYSNYGHQGRYVHCFTKNHITPWSAGYASTDESQMWNDAIREGRGGISAYRAISMIRPDMSAPYSTGAALARFAKAARSGMAKALQGANVEYPGDVAIHFSPDCMRGTWGLGFDQDKIRDTYCDMLENLGYQYYYLSTDAIKAGKLTPARYKMLILPCAVSLSKAETDAITRYVAHGGVVFADLYPGVFNNHCSPRKNPLSPLFGVDLNELGKPRGRGSVVWGGVEFKPQLIGALGLKEPEIHKFGKGFAIYADAVPISLYNSLRDKAGVPECARKADALENGFIKYLKLAGAAPPAAIPGKTTHPKARFSRFVEGNSEYLVAVNRGYREKPTMSFVWNVPKNKYVYDLKNGGLVSKGGAVKLTFKGAGAAYAALPYKIASFTASAPKILAAGQLWSGKAVVAAADGKSPGRHVVRMEVRQPDGTLRKEYTFNYDAPNGTAKFAVPFAMNDPQGVWSVKLRDVFSGKEVTLHPELRGVLGCKPPLKTPTRCSWKFDDPANPAKSDSDHSSAFFTGSAPTSVGGPSKTNGAVRISPSTRMIIDTGFAPQASGLLENYSFMIDFKLPEKHGRFDILRTDPTKNRWANLSVNPDGGIRMLDIGSTFPLIKPGKWARLLLAVAGKSVSLYLDGFLVATASGVKNFGFVPSKLTLFSGNKNSATSADIAEIRVFAEKLSPKRAAELAGFPPPELALKTKFFPYLQTPRPKSMTIAWYQGFVSNSAKVEYGTDASSLKSKTALPSIKGVFPQYFMTEIDGLRPETSYVYRIVAGNRKSRLFSFKTPPAPGSPSKDGHIRFVIYGDSRSYADRHAAIVADMREDLEKSFGKPVENFVDAVFNVGDIVGDGRKFQQYFPYYFHCVSSLARDIPFMVIIGNHEKEADYCYDHMAYEPFAGPQGERYYSFAIGKVAFIVTNTDVLGETQFKWVGTMLNKYQNDKNIDWIVMLSHYPIYSESWHHKYSYRAWLTERVYPLALKFPKVALFAYGHTHAYERGAAKDAPAYLLMNGGGGAPLENWKKSTKAGKTFDYPQIVKCEPRYGYSFVDIDVPAKKMSVVSYELGNGRHVAVESKVMDRFELDRNNNARPPKPVLSLAKNAPDGQIVLVGTPYQGESPITYSEFRIFEKRGGKTKVLKDVLRSAVNIYDVAPNGSPIDHAAGKDITRLALKRAYLKNAAIFAKLRYRNANLAWSPWSEPIPLKSQ